MIDLAYAYEPPSELISMATNSGLIKYNPLIAC